MANKYRVIRFGGDGKYDWAVFRSKDIKGLRSPISEYTNAKPIYTGCGKDQAQELAKNLEGVKNDKR